MTGIGHLDQTLASAAKHNIKVILTLANNWEAFGGIDWYIQTFNATYHDDFFTNPSIISAYKNYMKWMLNHVNPITGVAYKDDPTIMAFELCNEPRCVGTGPVPSSNSCVPATLTGWVDEVSTYFKEIDSNHLLAIGDEGYFNHPDGPSYNDAYTNIWDGTSGDDFDANIRLPNIDFGIFLMTAKN